MKTPEEIKKGLEICSIGTVRECMKCPYPIGFECFETPMKDALDYIRQLESRLAQVERERDAAVKDISEASIFACRVCTENDWPNCKAGNYWNMNDEQPVCCEHFNWRGVCPENTKEGNVV